MRNIKNVINSSAHSIICLALLLLAGACGELRPDYETPTVNVSYFRPLSAQGIAPRFGIGLHIINPNDFDLDIRGISYTVSIQGQKIIVGVARDLAPIAAYSEGNADLLASTDMISGIRLITGLMREGRSSLTYKLDAKLDIRDFGRRVHVVREGTFSFSGEK